MQSPGSSLNLQPSPRPQPTTPGHSVLGSPLSPEPSCGGDWRGLQFHGLSTKAPATAERWERESSALTKGSSESQEENYTLKLFQSSMGFFVCDRIFSCSMLALSYSLWDQVPWPGIKPRPPALGAQSLTYWTTREVPVFNFSIVVKIYIT